MEFSSTPQLIVAITISAYWACVFAMTLRSWVKFKVPSGSLPKTKLEKRMWMIWVPTITAWIALSWKSISQITQALETSGNTGFGTAWSIVMWGAAIVAVFAFIATTQCWMKMGQNWSMAVRPDKETELITDGMFSRVRHPIYSLSLLLMICTLTVITNWGMAIVATSHCSLLILKSWNEEKYLTKTHGQQYREYLLQTNRFIPVGSFANRV